MDYDNKVQVINLQLTALKERFEHKINIRSMAIR